MSIRRPGRRPDVAAGLDDSSRSLMQVIDRIFVLTGISLCRIMRGMIYSIIGRGRE